MEPIKGEELSGFVNNNKQDTFRRPSVLSFVYETQKKVALSAYNKDRCWFNKLMATYTSLLKQVAQWKPDEVFSE